MFLFTLVFGMGWGAPNLLFALRAAMGMCGAFTIPDMHQAELVVAPAIKTEGKYFQLAGRW